MKPALILAALLLWSAWVPAAADEPVSGQYLAQTIAPLLGREQPQEIFDFGILEQETFGRTLCRMEAVAAFVKIWEIRCGMLMPGALGSFFDDYLSVGPQERRVLDKAVMIGVLPDSSSSFKAEKPLQMQEMERMEKQLIHSIDVMQGGIEEPIYSFWARESRITKMEYDTPIDLFCSIPADCISNAKEAILVLAVYAEGRLEQVTVEICQDVERQEPFVFHATTVVPKEKEPGRIKAFLWNEHLRPLSVSAVLK